MGLVYYSKNPVDWYELEGIYIALTQPPTPAAISSNAGLTKIVAELPWGPVGEIIECGSGKEFVGKVVGQAATPEDYKGVQSVTGKQWGKLVLSRVGHSGQSKSSVTLADTTPDDAYTIEALYPGAVGDEIQYEHVDNGDGTFDLTITWGQTSTTLGGLALTAASLDAVDHPFVDLVLVDDTADVPADETGNLAGGSDGSPGDSDYSDALDVLEGADDGGVVFAAEYTSSAWISALQTHVDLFNRTLGFAQADSADDVATNITSAEGLSDKKLLLAGHRVQQFLDSTLTKVDLVPWLASVAANVSPHISIAAYRTNEFLQGIQGFGGGIGKPTRSDYVSAREAGLILLERDEGKWIPKSGYMSDGYPIGNKFNRVRMEGLVGHNIGQALKPFKAEPSYPSNVTGARVAQERRLDLLKGTPEIPDSQLIEEYSVELIDETSTSVIYQTKAKMFGDMDSIIANVEVGPTVEITIE